MEYTIELHMTLVEPDLTPAFITS